MKTIKDKYLLVGADTAGFPIKEAVVAHLKAQGWTIEDIGVTDYERDKDDLNLMFHRVGLRVGAKIASGEYERAMVFCGTGTHILSDSDNLVLRPEFSTLAQARTRVSIYGLSGLPVTVGDTIASLDAPRIDLLRRIMPFSAQGATLLSVSRHITQGGYELASFRSDAHEVSGAVKCPDGETVKVTLLLPGSRGAITSSHPCKLEGDVLRLELSPVSSETVEWHVAF